MKDDYMILLFLISEKCVHCKNLLNNLDKIKKVLNQKYRLVYVTAVISNDPKDKFRLKNKSYPIGLNDFSIGMAPTVLLINKDKWNEAISKPTEYISLAGHVKILNFKLNEKGFFLKNENGFPIRYKKWINFLNPLELSKWIEIHYPKINNNTLINDDNNDKNLELIKHRYEKFNRRIII